MRKNDSTTHRACVFTPGAVFYGSGQMVGLRAGVHTDLRQILAGTVDRFAQHCTVVIDGVSVVDLAAGDVRVVRADGWQFSKLGPWTLFYRADGRTVAVGCRADMAAPHFGVLFAPDTEPGVVAMLLDRYHRATGMAWRGTCATTALAAIRLTWQNSTPLWNHPKVGPKHAVGPLIWSRPLTAVERSWGWVHTFDATAAYLGAAGVSLLAWSTLHNTRDQPFSKHRSGYWHVRLSEDTLALNDDPSRPPLLPAGRVRDGCVWLTTPYAELIGELGDPLDVIDSWTGDDSRRVLRTWGESIRDARLTADKMPAAFMGTMRTAIKRTYKDAIGGMQREGMRIYRPDWAHTVIDQWRANLYRRMVHVRDAQGSWPVQVKTDSLAYPDCIPIQPDRSEFETLPQSLRVGACAISRCGCAPNRTPALGTFKHESVATAEEWTS